MSFVANFRRTHRDVVDAVELAEAAILLLAAPIWLLIPAHRWKQATPLVEKNPEVKAASRPNRVRISDAVDAIEVCTFVCEKSSSASTHAEQECEASGEPSCAPAEPEACSLVTTEAAAFAAEPLSWWCLMAAILHSIAMADPIELRLNVASVNKRIQESWSRGGRCCVEIQTCVQAHRRKRAQDRADAEALALAEAAAEAARLAEEAERRCRAAARRQAGPVGKYVPPHLRNKPCVMSEQSPP
mmetsp:Transcript_13947/g.25741  ORF Transcript_13947/g.25741 Transcript_13947/m.25741 type:complete len:244 (+) Transcript_13947:86-817(+)